MATTEDFRASDLIGSAGIGSNAEKLIDTLTYHVPPELDAAMTRRINESLTAKTFPTGDSESDQDTAGKSRSAVAKFAGVKNDENLTMEAVVRGGERNPADAWVTYVYLDERGTDVKGAFPYSDLGKSSSDRHISQRSSVMKSPAARDHLAAQAKADNAPSGDAEVQQLRDELAALSARLDEDPGDPEPVKDYGKANASNIVTMLGAVDRATVVRVLEYEEAHDGRSTVTKAAEKRIQALDDEAADAEAKQEAIVAENAALQARIAELEEQLTAPPADGDENPPQT